MDSEIAGKTYDVLKKMTLGEKLALQTGADMLRTAGVPRLGVPQITLADGPSGLRLCENGKTVPAVCMPVLSCLASSFDEKLVEEVGAAIAAECKENGVHILLAPGINIKRNALCGRNFEYFSEDPLLAGKLGAAYVRGVQKEGVGACVKHFACNNAETGRLSVNPIVDERALREIYFSGFETVIREARPACLMSAYNMLNGVYCAENAELINILKDEWGFGGVVTTDWWANSDRVKGIMSRTDIQMPNGDTGNIEKALGDGSLTMEALDGRVLKILGLTEKYKNAKFVKTDENALLKTARKAAAESIVLLKNDGVLPLSPNDKLLVTGDFALKPHSQGNGSSHVKETFSPIGLCGALTEAGVPFTFEKGYAEGRKSSAKLLNRAVAEAKKATKTIVVIGTERNAESEGYDRLDLNLPNNQLELCRKLIEVNKNVIVVLQTGSVVSLPFKNGAAAIIQAGLGGQECGNALFDVLYGAVNPSGRLAETYIKKAGDRPFTEKSGERDMLLGESVYVGYRYYDAAKTDIEYPFGYGLSYTRFEYTDIRLSASEIDKTDSVKLLFRIKNVGERDGADVAMAFVGAETGGAFRPEKELRGFKKIFLRAGEERDEGIELPPRSFSYFDVRSRRFETDGGKYEVALCRSATECLKKSTLKIRGEKISENLSDILPSYYNLCGGFRFDCEQFSKLYGKKNLPLVASGPVKPYNANTVFRDITDCRIGKFFNNIFRIGAKIFKRRNYELYMNCEYALPMLPVRSLPMLAPCFDDKACGDFLRAANGDTLKNVFPLFCRRG
jgi:beta-glucosidase